MPDIVELMASFVQAAYGQISPELLRYTTEVREDVLYTQVVVLDAISEAALDEATDISGYMLSDFMELIGDEQVVRVHSIKEARRVQPLPVRLFAQLAVVESPSDVTR